MDDEVVCESCGALSGTADQTCRSCGRPVNLPKQAGALPPQSGASARPGGGGWRPAPSVESGEQRRDGPDEGSPSAPAVLPSEGSHAVVEGQARGLQSRSEQGGDGYHEAVWSFRVERYDGTGRRVLLVPVEMRGRTFEGSINDGDWVRAEGRLRGGTLRATLVQNLTTGAVVRAKGYPKPFIVVFIVVFLLIVVFIAWIALFIFSAASDGPPDFPEVPTEFPR